jgi:hypothetical protein
MPDDDEPQGPPEWIAVIVLLILLAAFAVYY